MPPRGLALPVRNALTTWGLLYNEEFNGCWFGPLLYSLETRTPIFPFCHRRILEITLSLPADYRRANRMPEDLIRK